MADKLDEILSVVKTLNVKLYGEDGFEGDIPEIRKAIINHSHRLRTIELIIAGLIGSGAVTGGIVGIIRLLG